MVFVNIIFPLCKILLPLKCLNIIFKSNISTLLKMTKDWLLKENTLGQIRQPL